MGKKSTEKKASLSAKSSVRKEIEKNNGASPELRTRSCATETGRGHEQHGGGIPDKASQKRPREVLTGEEAQEGGKKHKMDEELRKFIKSELEKVASKEQLDSFAQQIASNTEKISSMDKRMKEQGEEIKSVRGAVRQLELRSVEERRGLDKKIREAVSVAVDSKMASGANPMRMEERKFDEYDLARKSLRIWPIEGITDLEMRDSIENFVMNALLVDSFSQEWISSIKRAPTQSRGAAYNEVVVTFSDKERRDEVFAARTKLGTYVDGDGKPTSGLRMQIPGYLMPTFKILEAYGYELRGLHGPNFRRYIKFDEFERTLFLQVKFPNIDEWFNISAEEARISRQRKNNRRIASAREFFSPEPKLGEKRSVSLGSEMDCVTISDSPPNPPTIWTDTARMLTTTGASSSRRQTWKPKKKD